MNGKKDMVVFVKLDEYNEVKNVLNLMRSKLNEARYFLKAVSDLKNREDAEIDSINAELGHIEERVGVVDRLLTEPEM